MQFTDEQIQAIAEALRLANNAGRNLEGLSDIGNTRSVGVAAATDQVARMLAHGNPEFERESFLGRVYTTTVERPADWEPTDRQQRFVDGVHPSTAKFADLADSNEHAEAVALGDD